MHLGIRESVALARGVLRTLRGSEETPDVILCPSYTSLAEVHKVLARSRVQLGAQSTSIAKSGAYTGEISVSMLEDVGCAYTLIGHSERRELFHADNVIVAQSYKTTLDSKLTPVLCVGEPKEVRDGSKADAYVKAQLESALKNVTIPARKQVIVAYEPIWAIGTGKPAELVDIVKMHQFVRKNVARLTGRSEEKIAVLYGGSVDGTNAYDFLRESEIDGLLVGGASIKLQQFSEIIRAGIDVVTAQTSL